MYSVPHDDKDDIKEEGDVKVMASHAIFRMDAGKEAPGCVVGFQFEQNFMYKRFISITKQHDRNVIHQYALRTELLSVNDKIYAIFCSVTGVCSVTKIISLAM